MNAACWPGLRAGAVASLRAAASATLLITGLAKLWLPGAAGLLLPLPAYWALGLIEVALAAALWSPWRRPAAIAVVALAALGCGLILAGLSHTCGCAGAIRLTLARHYALVAVLGGAGSLLLAHDGAAARAASR